MQAVGVVASVVVLVVVAAVVVVAARSVPDLARYRRIRKM
ncbi:MAG: DUF6893 family small protein [Acidimicrobiales bacterium]